MTRCYTFPPPGYEIPKESLIHCCSIGLKIQEKVEKVKKDRKHKRKEMDNETDRSKNHRHKRQRKDDVEFLEKSCLTVELDVKTSSSQNSCCDSTLHRPKKTQTQSESESESDQPLDNDFVCAYLLLGLCARTMVTFFLQICCYGLQQTALRIRQKDLEVMMTNKDQKKLHELVGHPNSVPRVVDALRICQDKEKYIILDSSRDITTKLSKQKRKISKEKKPYSRHQDTIKSSKKLSCRKHPTSSMAVQFLNLVENWVPDRVERNKLTDSEDQEWWLFVGAKRQYQVVCNQITSKPTSSSSSSLMLWPTARFLPEARVHALPFTVPF